jgi:hypothetical protein
MKQNYDYHFSGEQEHTAYEEKIWCFFTVNFSGKVEK